jgi:hypothetical protein
LQLVYLKYKSAVLQWQNIHFKMSRPAQPKDLLLMFDRPTEPIFMPKGDNNSVAFDVPPALLVSPVLLCLN